MYINPRRRPHFGQLCARCLECNITKIMHTCYFLTFWVPVFWIWTGRIFIEVLLKNFLNFWSKSHWQRAEEIQDASLFWDSHLRSGRERRPPQTETRAQAIFSCTCLWWNATWKIPTKEKNNWQHQISFLCTILK